MFPFILDKVVPRLIILDDRLCSFFYKSTGIRSRFKYTVLFILPVLAKLAYHAATADWFSRVIDILVMAIYVWLIIDYRMWLQDKTRGLKTVQIAKKHFRLDKIETLLFIIVIFTILSAFFIPPLLLNFGWWTLSTAFECVVVLMVFTAICHDGPPLPDATYWARAKNKIKSIIPERQKTPALVPVRV